MSAIGCGARKPEAKTSGRVTFQGKPLSESALLSFYCAEHGVQIAAEIESNGRYRMLGAKGAGLPPGKYVVSVMPKSVLQLLANGAELSDNTPCPPDFPRKYLTPEKSGLTCEIKQGENTFDIDMKP